jgi:hypothetical protein
VLNAEAVTTEPCVQRIQILQQYAPYAEEITRQITNVATYIKTFKKQEAKQQFNHDKTLLNYITQILTSTIIISSFKPQSTSSPDSSKTTDPLVSNTLTKPAVTQHIRAALNVLK